jgi:hypothetical protein
MEAGLRISVKNEKRLTVMERIGVFPVRKKRSLVTACIFL